ncbi:MAG: SRPBCC family protein [Steroidobacteraceae bacterium]
MASARPCSLALRPALLTAALVIAALQPGRATAAQIGPIRIALHDGGYDVAFDAVVEAPRDRVFAILSDYAHLARINPQITSSSSRRSPTGAGERVRTVLHSCIWVFCKNLVQIEDVRARGSNTLIARIIPGGGDFSGGTSLWHLERDGAATRLHYEATRKLTAWLPPFIGTAVVKHTLRAQFRATINALERLARRKH